MTDTRSGSALPTIFAFFLGLMVSAFVGVGVYTFYPPPDQPYAARLTAISRESMDLQRGKAPEQLTDEERARLQVLSDEQDALQDQVREAHQGWSRTTSIILVVLATLTMAVAVVSAGELPVVGNGLLLGGLFTMVWGVGWIVATDSTRARFWVIALALVITIGLGYLRFVRRGRVAPPSAASAAAAAAPSELEARVRRLEERLDDAARAMGQAPRP